DVLPRYANDPGEEDQVGLSAREQRIGDLLPCLAVDHHALAQTVNVALRRVEEIDTEATFVVETTNVRAIFVSCQRRRSWRTGALAAATGVGLDAGVATSVVGVLF